jgi:hypothetical protein
MRASLLFTLVCAVVVTAALSSFVAAQQGGAPAPPPPPVATKIPENAAACAAVPAAHCGFVAQFLENCGRTGDGCGINCGMAGARQSSVVDLAVLASECTTKPEFKDKCELNVGDLAAD